jgi:hypothetical protein
MLFTLSSDVLTMPEASGRAAEAAVKRITRPPSPRFQLTYSQAAA